MCYIKTKALLLSFFLIATTVGGYSQTRKNTKTVTTQSPKPSKEETIKFINDVLVAYEGHKSGGLEMRKITFSANELTRVWALDEHEYPATYTIKWETFTSFGKEEKIDDDFTDIAVNFSSKISVPLSNGKIGYLDAYGFWIPAAKLPSFKKAILRLVEISKEEHKDPFAN